MSAKQVEDHLPPVVLSSPAYWTDDAVLSRFRPRPCGPWRSCTVERHASFSCPRCRIVRPGRSGADAALRGGLFATLPRRRPPRDRPAPRQVYGAASTAAPSAAPRALLRSGRTGSAVGWPASARSAFWRRPPRQTPQRPEGALARPRAAVSFERPQLAKLLPGKGAVAGAEVVEGVGEPGFACARSCAASGGVLGPSPPEQRELAWSSRAERAERSLFPLRSAQAK